MPIWVSAVEETYTMLRVTIYFTPEAGKILRGLRGMGKIGKIERDLDERSNLRSLEVEAYDPVVDLIPNTCIKFVAASEVICNGFVNDGVYRDSETTSWLEAHTRVIAVGGGEDGLEIQTLQDLDMRAPDVAALLALRSLVRRKKLQPAEDFEALNPFDHYTVHPPQGLD